LLIKNYQFSGGIEGIILDDLPLKAFVVKRKLADNICILAYYGKMRFETLFVIRQPPCIGDTVHLIRAVIPLKFDDLHL